jgi:hypothetical protein
MVSRFFDSLCEIIMRRLREPHPQPLSLKERGEKVEFLLYLSWVKIVGWGIRVWY